MDGAPKTLADQQTRLQHTGNRRFDRIAAGSGDSDDGGHRDAGLAGEKLTD